MKVSLLVIGKTADSYLEEGIRKYEKRLKYYFPFEIEYVPTLKNSAGLSSGQLKEKEADVFLKRMSPKDYLILLDEKGKEYTSPQFASEMEKIMNRGVSAVKFVIAGAFGAGASLKARADATISLSKMTFSHQLVRLIFMEQLYRSMTILKNHSFPHWTSVAAVGFLPRKAFLW